MEAEGAPSVYEALDVGPKHYPLQAAVREVAGRLVLLLGFAGDERVAVKAQELALLVSSFRSAPSEVKVGRAAVAIADYVYTSNMIEGEQLDQGVTRSIVERRLMPGSQPTWRTGDPRGAETPTLALLELVLSERDPAAETFSAGSRADWIEWHRALMDGVVRARPGQLRRCMVFAGSHQFPHHTVVPDALNKLDAVARVISATKRAWNLADRFALAALLQFHFVHIHPFCDGNGRMCRFLAKKALDGVLPLPFPQFTDRNAYLEAIALDQGPAASLPLRLCVLMLDEAIRMYRGLAHATASAAISLTTRALDTDREEVVGAFCREHGISKADTLKITRAWREMPWWETAEIELTSPAGRIKRVALSKPVDVDSI